MGHYYSEMGFDEEDRKREEAFQKRIKDRADRIQRAIDNEGLPMVLSKIIEGSKQWSLTSPPEFFEYRDNE